MRVVLPAAKRRWMPLAALFLVLATMFAVAGALQFAGRPAHAAAGEWPMFLGSDARTGYNGGETAINATTAANLHVTWTHSTGSRINAQPIVAGGQIYTGSWNGNEYATDPSGKQLWAAPIGGQTANCSPPDVFGVGSSPEVADVTIGGASTQVVFVGGKDPHSKVASLYALKAADGTTLWETPLSATPASFVWSSPVLYSGSVYVGLSSMNDCPLVRGALLRLDAATGAIQNTFYTVPVGCIGASIWSSPAIDDATGTLFVTTGNNGTCSSPEPYAQAIVELNASDLSYVDSWQVPASQHRVDSDFGATPTLFTAIIAGSTRAMVGVVNKNGAYYALDQNSLHSGPVWQQAISTSTISISSSAWDGAALYVAGRTTTIDGKSCRGSLRALDPATGAFRWQDCLNDGNILAPVSAVAGVAFVGEGTHILGIATAAGNILFNYSTSNTIEAAPAISNGSLYVANNSGTLYAFGLSNAPTPTPSPSASPSGTPGATLAQDTFARNAQSLWGTASDGQTWGADANALGNFSISNGAGQVAGSGGGARSYTAVLGPVAANAQVLFSGSLGSLGSNTMGALLRWSAGSNFYKAYVDGGRLQISKKVNGVITRLASVAFPATAGVSYTILFAASGSTLSASAWPTSGSQPAAWMVTVSDSSLPSGSCGVLVFLASGIVAGITSFQATSLS